MSVSVPGQIAKAGRRLYVALDDENHYRERLSTTFREGQRVRVTVEPMTRSVEANAYLWDVVYETIVGSLNDGTTADDLHDAMCERFLPRESKRMEFFSRLTGETITITIDSRRSSKLGGLDFYDFVETVRGFARDFLSIDTPDPDPQYWRKQIRAKRTRAA